MFRLLRFAIKNYQEEVQYEKKFLNEKVNASYTNSSYCFFWTKLYRG
jgi:hypothetical protein